MTEQEKTAALENMQQVLFTEVLAPAFVKLAAEKGVNITNEDEFNYALSMACDLEAYHSQQNKENNLLKQASEALKGKLYGSQPVRNNTGMNAFAKQAAALPSVRAAVAAAAQAR